MTPTAARLGTLGSQRAPLDAVIAHLTKRDTDTEPFV
jgi:hypothetical protein